MHYAGELLFSFRLGLLLFPFLLLLPIHLAPCPPLLTCQFITKPIILLHFFLWFCLPMVGGDLENVGNEKVEFSLDTGRNLNMHAIAIF